MHWTYPLELTVRIEKHKLKESSRPIDRTALTKPERNWVSTFQGMAKYHTTDWDNTKIFQRGFWTQTERSYVEALQLSPNPIRINLNDGGKIFNIWTSLLSLMKSHTGNDNKLLIFIDIHNSV